MTDIAIRRGTVVTPRGELVADVGITGEKISEVGQVRTAAREIEAKGKLVLPGVVDMHTHLGARGLDDVAAGTRGAAAGGVTTVLTFAHQQPGGGLVGAADAFIAGARGASVDVGLHVVVTDPSERAVSEMPEVAARGLGLKIFMVAPAFDERRAEHLRVLRAAARERVLVAMHAEDHGTIAWRTRELLDEGKTGVAHFADSRPVEAEEIAVRAACGYAAATGAHVYLVHLSSKRAIDALRDARARRLPVYGETRPLYLYLTRRALEKPDGAIFVGQPPLREQSDVDAIWKALADGTLSTVGTDHFPWPRERKLDPSLPFDRIPPGVANLQTLLPMLYSEGVRKGRITLRRLVEVLSSEPARLAGLPQKGRLEVGADADVVVFDPDRSRAVRSEDLVSNADHDPFAGWQVTGWPATVVCRGRVVWQHGEHVDAAGHGRWLSRAALS